MIIARNNIGEVLRLLRISFDLTISELSQRTSISKSYITEIEKGVKNPSAKILEKYSKGLGIPDVEQFPSKAFAISKIVVQNIIDNRPVVNSAFRQRCEKICSLDCRRHLGCLLFFAL